MNLRAVLVTAVVGISAFGQATPTVKQAPPPGIDVPPDMARELRASLNNLNAEITALERTVDSRTRSFLPDIQVFHKAVSYALVYNEFFKAAEFENAKQQLAAGLQRSHQLRSGNLIWTTRTGPNVFAYQSKIDASIQPYGLHVPENWDKSETNARPLYLWFHGRNDTLSEVAFIAGQTKGKREFAPPEAF
jgi:hypothetical protein